MPYESKRFPPSVSSSGWLKCSGSIPNNSSVSGGTCITRLRCEPIRCGRGEYATWSSWHKSLRTLRVLDRGERVEVVTVGFACAEDRSDLSLDGCLISKAERVPNIHARSKSPQDCCYDVISCVHKSILSPNSTRLPSARPLIWASAWPSTSANT